MTPNRQRGRGRESQRERKRKRGWTLRELTGQDTSTAGLKDWYFDAVLLFQPHAELTFLSANVGLSHMALNS